MEKFIARGKGAKPKGSESHNFFHHREMKYFQGCTDVKAMGPSPPLKFKKSSTTEHYLLGAEAVELRYAQDRLPQTARTVSH